MISAWPIPLFTYFTAYFKWWMIFCYCCMCTFWTFSSCLKRYLNWSWAAPANRVKKTTHFYWLKPPSSLFECHFPQAYLLCWMFCPHRLLNVKCQLLHLPRKAVYLYNKLTYEFFWGDSIRPFYYAHTCMNQAYHGENQNLRLKEFQQNKHLKLGICKQDIQGV